MHTLRQMGLFLIVSVPTTAFAGVAVVELPEPGILSLFALGGVGLALFAKSRRK